MYLARRCVLGNLAVRSVSPLHHRALQPPHGAVKGQPAARAHPAAERTHHWHEVQAPSTSAFTAAGPLRGRTPARHTSVPAPLCSLGAGCVPPAPWDSADARSCRTLLAAGTLANERPNATARREAGDILWHQAHGGRGPLAVQQPHEAFWHSEHPGNRLGHREPLPSPRTLRPHAWGVPGVPAPTLSASEERVCSCQNSRRIAGNKRGAGKGNKRTSSSGTRAE